MIFRQAAATAPKGGRVAQKERTRAELLRAARQLRASGRVPTVSDVADAANISRTTAYRYFPTQEMLLAEAAAEPLVQAVADAITRAGGNGDVLERVDTVFAELAPLMLRHEPELRALLKIALERSLAEAHERKIPLLSGAWVRAWDPILDPLRGEVPPVTYALMVRSLGTLLAVETLNVLRDACDMDDAAATAAIRAAARAMTRGFLLDSTRRKPQ